QWLPSLVLVGVGLVALIAGGSATPMPAASLLPTFSNLDTIIFFSQICFAFAGLELAPVLAGEIREPRRTIPRALLISGIVIAGIYIFNTLALMWALPPDKISIIAGVNQAIAAAGAAHGLSWLGPPVALLMTLAGIGGLGAWLIGSARLLFVGGMDRLLPPAFARIHPRWNTPYIALLVQAALAAIFILAATQGSTVHVAYLILVDATAILTFLVYLYLFAAAIKLRRRIAGTPEAIAVPGGAFGSIVANGLGFLTTSGAIALALVPPSDTSDKAGFFLKVIGGTVGFFIAGLVLHWLAKRRAMR
ncbi:MAG: amino acid permease, partial [Xanthomonadaceae bacterium]|nr:amino acid permease [Xanthomonadaceae bacterium]